MLTNFTRFRLVWFSSNTRFIYRNRFEDVDMRIVVGFSSNFRLSWDQILFGCKMKFVTSTLEFSGRSYSSQSLILWPTFFFLMAYQGLFEKV